MDQNSNYLWILMSYRVTAIPTGLVIIERQRIQWLCWSDSTLTTRTPSSAWRGSVWIQTLRASSAQTSNSSYLSSVASSSKGTQRVRMILSNLLLRHRWVVSSIVIEYGSSFRQCYSQRLTPHLSNNIKNLRGFSDNWRMRASKARRDFILLTLKM